MSRTLIVANSSRRPEFTVRVLQSQLQHFGFLKLYIQVWCAMKCVLYTFDLCVRNTSAAKDVWPEVYELEPMGEGSWQLARAQ
eukprot:3336917-Amphidinium_carterae.1